MSFFAKIFRLGARSKPVPEAQHSLFTAEQEARIVEIAVRTGAEVRRRTVFR